MSIGPWSYMGASNKCRGDKVSLELANYSTKEVGCQEIRSTDNYRFKSCILWQNAELLSSGRKSVWNHPNKGVFLSPQKREYRLRLYPEWSAAQFRIQCRYPRHSPWHSFQSTSNAGRPMGEFPFTHGQSPWNSPLRVIRGGDLKRRRF